MNGVNWLDVIFAIGSWISAIAAIVAIYVALYVNYDSNLPQVVVFLEHDRDHACISLVVANYGKGIARNVTLTGFDFAQVFDSLKEEVKGSFISTGVQVLVPGASRNTVILAGSDMKSYASKNSTVTVSYETKGFPFGKKTVEESFVLDYRSFVGSVYVDSDAHVLAKAMSAISKTLEKKL